MSLYKPSALVSLVLLFSLNSSNSYATSQLECCTRLYQGIFLPLACGQFLGGSVLTLPERVMMQMPPPSCGPVNNVTPSPMLMRPRYPFYGLPIFPGMPMMLYSYPMLRF